MDELGRPTEDKFEIHVAEDVLEDLRSRLRNPRLSPGFEPGDWSSGTDATYLAELLEYWRDEYDWGKHEAQMNMFSHFTTTIDGIPIHYIHERGKGPSPIPLIMSHGWPWTFWDFQKVIGPLTDPAAYGGDPRDAFDVVVPSLPGFGFSSPLQRAGVTFSTTADMWHELMTTRLGYERYAAQGGDWGAWISAQLGHKYAASLYGIHLHLTAFLALEPMPMTGYTAEEEHWRQRSETHFAMGSGYANIQFTRPQTIGHALDDSPTALASWIVEKRRDWSDSHGDVESRFSKDDLCTVLTLYWVTRTGGSYARYYGEFFRNGWSADHDRQPVVEAPTGFALFPEDLFRTSREWTESYYNVRRYREMPRGGHFAPMEEPDLLIDEIRAFFSEDRDSRSTTPN